MSVTLFQQIISDILEWVKDKARLDFNARQLGKSVNNIAVRRGEIFECELGYNIGSEKSKRRPVLVVQNDKGNHYSATTIVVPLTSKNPKKLPTHFTLYRKDFPDLANDSVVQCEKIREIDKIRLGKLIATIPSDKMDLVDAKLKKALNLT